MMAKQWLEEPTNMNTFFFRGVALTAPLKICGEKRNSLVGQKLNTILFCFLLSGQAKCLWFLRNFGIICKNYVQILLPARIKKNFLYKEEIYTYSTYICMPPLPQTIIIWLHITLEMYVQLLTEIFYLFKIY